MAFARPVGECGDSIAGFPRDGSGGGALRIRMTSRLVMRTRLSGRSRRRKCSLCKDSPAGSTMVVGSAAPTGVATSDRFPCLGRNGAAIRHCGSTLATPVRRRFSASRGPSKTGVQGSVAPSFPNAPMPYRGHRDIEGIDSGQGEPGEPRPSLHERRARVPGLRITMRIRKRRHEG